MPVPGGLDKGLAEGIGVLVSGEGTILEALADRAREGRLGAPILLVIADREGTGAVGRARRLGLAHSVIPRRTAAEPGWGDVIDQALRSSGVTLVVLDGFLSILPETLVAKWRGRILNVHPSLLPAHGGPGMYGPKVHAAVLRAGDRETGVTVHEVTEAVDRGPILVQLRIAVDPSDTPASLRERLRPLEVDALTRAIRAKLLGADGADD